MLILAWPRTSSAQPAARNFHALDLAAFFTNAIASDAPDAFAFPRGAQQFADIPFTMGGRIELAGLDAARRGEFVLTEVTGLPAHQMARRLHLLHGALHGQRDGIPLANVVLHFKNGETRALRLAFGVHARNCVETGGNSRTELADPNSRLAWSGDQRGSNLRLYQTVFDNPLPDEQISTIDFVALFSRATPVFFAVTLQTDGGTTPLLPLPQSKIVQRANQFGDAAYRRELTVRATDATSGTALSSSIAMVTLRDDARSFFFGRIHANAFGQMVVPYPPQEAVAMSLRVGSPGYTAGSAVFTSLDAKKWPDALDVPLEHGSTVGGVVVDPTGRPLPDVSVIPFQITKTGTNQYTRTDLETAPTGPEGRWRSQAPPLALSNLTFEIAHPKYHTATVQFASADLLGTNTRAVLQPHLLVAGRVINKAGQPLPRATVILIDSDDTREIRNTDASGTFFFVVSEPGNTPSTLVAVATDYAPVSRTITPKTASALELTLDAGHAFSLRMTDGKSNPVPGVAVSLSRWQGKQALEWKTQTDADGRFKWDHAPDGPVTFRFEKTGYLIHTHSFTLPLTREATFTYTRPTRIAGWVIDAATRKPVDQFRYRTQYRYVNGSGNSSGTGRKGTFSTTVNDAYTSVSLTIEASGYQPLTNNLVPESGSSSNVYALKKAQMVEGVVLAPNGSPAVGTELVLLGPRLSAYMEDEPGKFRRSSFEFDIVVADAAGRFAFTPVPDADFVLASHPKLGFVQAPAADVLKSGRVTLQPWGHVHGVLRVGNKVEPYQYAAVHTHYQSESGATRTSSPLWIYYKLRPEADGHFAFDAVPPGERMVQLRYIFWDKETGGMKLSHNLPITVKAGETNDVIIGGTGRTVTGKVDVVGVKDLVMDWQRGTFVLRLSPAAMPSEIPPPFRLPPNATAEERQKLMKQRQDELSAWSRNRVLANRLAQRTYLPIFDDDGSFHIPSVPPGTYTLNVAPYDPRQPTSSQQLGSLLKTVVVPPGTAPFDAGRFELQARP